MRYLHTVIHPRLAVACTLLAIAAPMAPVSADTVNARFPREARTSNNTYMRLFPDLPAFAPRDDRSRRSAAQLGARGGLMDPQDNLADPLSSIVDPTFSPNNLDNPDMTAGITFVGQFLDHDITFDRRSELNTNANPNRTLNFRSAAFDLDHVYGRGPVEQPELYVQDGTTIKFRIDEIAGSAAVARGDSNRFDLPRDAFNEAIIADSRNDENVIIAQFHLAMLRFHNAVTEHLLAQNANGALTPLQLFEQTRRQVQWHYQWIVMHEFLPATIGPQRLASIVAQGPRYYDPLAVDETARDTDAEQRGRRGDRDNGNRRRGDRNADSVQAQGQRTGPARVPIEFSVAAYRFGHSQVRPSYRLNFGPNDDAQFFAFVLDNRVDGNATDPDDLRGGRRAPRRFIDWQTFFDLGDGNVRNNKLIDTQISSVLFALPGTSVAAPGLPNDGEISLASRNLIRHVNFGLPSGQDVARAMNAPVLDEADLAELTPFGMANSTPLWYYILKEAEVLEAGRRLGPVGGTIVGEVFVGLLLADPGSYVAADPGWQPTLPSAGGAGEFTVADLLRFSGAVVALQ